MLKVEIVSTQVEERQFPSKVQGQPPVVVRKQSAYVHTGAPYPLPVSIRLDQMQAPYGAGMYQIDPSSFYADKYGSLSIALKLGAPVQK